MAAFVGGVGWAELVRKWVADGGDPNTLFRTPLPRLLVVLQAERRGERIESADDWKRVRQKILDKRKAKKGY